MLPEITEWSLLEKLLIENNTCISPTFKQDAIVDPDNSMYIKAKHDFETNPAVRYYSFPHTGDKQAEEGYIRIFYYGNDALLDYVSADENSFLAVLDMAEQIEDEVEHFYVTEYFADKYSYFNNAEQFSEFISFENFPQKTGYISENNEAYVLYDIYDVQHDVHEKTDMVSVDEDSQLDEDIPDDDLSELIPVDSYMASTGRRDIDFDWGE